VKNIHRKTTLAQDVLADEVLMK